MQLQVIRGRDMQLSKENIQEKINLVVDKMMSLDIPDKTVYENLSDEEAKKIGFFARDFGMGHWDWPQGVGLFGLSLSGKENSNYIRKWAEEEIKKGLPKVNINTTCPMLTIMDFPEFEELSKNWMQKLLIELPRTEEMGLEHTTTGDTKDTIVRMKDQIWADTLFMTVLFMAKMGKKYKNQSWIDAAVYQLILHMKYLLDRESGLFYHGWDFSNKSNFGKNFWCRGNSWITMGIPLILSILEDDIDPSLKTYFINLYVNQIKTLLSLRDEKTKLWHTLIDDSSSYIETSGSAGIVAGIYFGISTGILDKEEYEEICNESVEGLLKEIDKTGTVCHVSAGTVISADPNSYKNILIQPMAYGQSLMLCALNGYCLIN